QNQLSNSVTERCAIIEIFITPCSVRKNRLKRGITAILIHVDRKFLAEIKSHLLLAFFGMRSALCVAQRKSRFKHPKFVQTVTSESELSNLTLSRIQSCALCVDRSLCNVF